MEQAWKDALQRAERVEEDGRRLEMDRERCRQEAELERLRSVAEEKRKWEERELEDRSPLRGSCGGASGPQEAVGPGGVGGNTRGGEGRSRVETAATTMGSGRLNASAPGWLASHTEPGTHTPLTTGGESVPQLITSASVSTLPITPMNALSMSLLPLANFIGDRLEEDGETFEEWLERLELIAATCHWDEGVKLVNIATRLRGPALPFYRICSPQHQR